MSTRLCCSFLVPAFHVQPTWKWLELASSVGLGRGYFRFRRWPELGRASGFSTALSLALYISDGWSYSVGPAAPLALHTHPACHRSPCLAKDALSLMLLLLFLNPGKPVWVIFYVGVCVRRVQCTCAQLRVRIHVSSRASASARAACRFSLVRVHAVRLLGAESSLVIPHQPP